MSVCTTSACAVETSNNPEPVKSSCGCSGTAAKGTASPAARTLDMELLYLDNRSCDRCRGTEDELDGALGEARSLLAAAGADVTVRKIHITSVAEAQAHRFRSSPTIRIGGSDIELAAKENACGACSELAGRRVDCRVWTWRGQEYSVPPKQMIVDAVLRAFYAPPPSSPDETAYEVPENIRRFFGGPEPK